MRINSIKNYIVCSFVASSALFTSCRKEVSKTAESHLIKIEKGFFRDVSNLDTINFSNRADTLYMTPDTFESYGENFINTMMKLKKGHSRHFHVVLRRSNG